jgi:hypothetical protein
LERVELSVAPNESRLLWRRIVELAMGTSGLGTR